MFLTYPMTLHVPPLMYLNIWLKMDVVHSGMQPHPLPTRPTPLAMEAGFPLLMSSLTW